MNKNLFSRIKQEYHDIDYVNQLNDKEKEWLSRFMEEDLGARLNHDGPKVYKKKTSKTEVYRRNNQRNRDLYSLIRATGKFHGKELTEEMSDYLQDEVNTNPEDSLIAMIDAKSQKSGKKS